MDVQHRCILYPSSLTFVIIIIIIILILFHPLLSYKRTQASGDPKSRLLLRLVHPHEPSTLGTSEVIWSVPFNIFVEADISFVGKRARLVYTITNGPAITEKPLHSTALFQENSESTHARALSCGNRITTVAQPVNCVATFSAIIDSPDSSTPLATGSISCSVCKW